MASSPRAVLPRGEGPSGGGEARLWKTDRLPPPHQMASACPLRRTPRHDSGTLGLRPRPHDRREKAPHKNGGLAFGVCLRIGASKVALLASPKPGHRLLRRAVQSGMRFSCHGELASGERGHLVVGRCRIQDDMQHIYPPKLAVRLPLKHDIPSLILRKALDHWC